MNDDLFIVGDWRHPGGGYLMEAPIRFNMTKCPSQLSAVVTASPTFSVAKRKEAIEEFKLKLLKEAIELRDELIKMDLGL